MASYPRQWWIDYHSKWRIIKNHAFFVDLQIDFDGVRFDLVLGWFALLLLYNADDYTRLDGALVTGYGLAWDPAIPVTTGALLFKNAKGNTWPVPRPQEVWNGNHA